MPSKQHVFISMRDGVRLAASLYVPDGDGPWPAVLEALPYRKDDVTSSYRPEYERIAAAGYVVCRVDLRGTGSSEGIAEDEYPAVERTDMMTVIDWLATQDWSTGNVGMYGTSYSGFNSIQLAMERPPALKAIIPIYATDDRYADDVHYMGGAVKQLDQVDYPSYMVALNALPPVPGVYGEGWREEWERRVRGTEPWVLTWLEHQRFDDYWRFGSLRPDYDRIQAATMIIAGWADGYRNNSLRTFEQLRCPTRLVIGPWAHASTDTSLPGPNIDLVPEMIRWWDRWLKDEDNGIDREPPIVLFAQRSTRPGATRPTMEGAWRYEPTWPAERLRPTPLALADAAHRRADRRERRRPRGPRRRRLDRVDLVRGQPAVGTARRPAAGRGVLAHLHVAGARARPGDPGARAADGVAHVLGPDRVPLGEALRRLPRRRVVARDAGTSSTSRTATPARNRRRWSPVIGTRSRSTWRRRRGRSRRATASAWTWPARTGRTSGPRPSPSR